MIVGLQGSKGVGKTTTAYELKEHFESLGLSVTVDSFASPVYQILSVLTGEYIESIKEHKSKPYRKENEVASVFIGKTRRELLQTIGTEVFRDSFHPDIWASILKAKYSNYSNSSIVIIDDNRFQNEYTYLDFSIRLKRDFMSDGVGDNHVSENQEIEFDLEFNLDTGSIEELAEIIIDSLGLQWRR